MTGWALIWVWENDPPESTVPLADADAAQHPFLVPHVLAQELANNVSAQTEAHHDQLRLRVRPLNVAHHGGKLPGTTWTGERRGEQLTYDTSKGQSAVPRSAAPLKVLTWSLVWHLLSHWRSFGFWMGYFFSPKTATNSNQFLILKNVLNSCAAQPLTFYGFKKCQLIKSESHHR